VYPELNPTIELEMAGKRAAQRAPEETIGERIRRYRKAKGLTQTELGDMVGLSQRLMTYYETQGGSPSADLLARFSAALGVPMNVLLGVDLDSRRAASPASRRPGWGRCCAARSTATCA